jgi:hypothetical protein
MKKSPMPGLALAVLTFLVHPVRAQQSPAVVSCCKCLDGIEALDLSTGQTSPADLLWTVNGGTAYTTAKAGAWLATQSPANWIQPVHSSTASNAVAKGIYQYKIQFTIPQCTIPATVVLDGSFTADNSAQAYFNTNPIASCAGPNCFTTPQGPVRLNVTNISAGTHTLEIDVNNNDKSFSGLAVVAHLSWQCAKCDPCPFLGAYDGANCFVGQAPSGTTVFIYANNFYYTPRPGHQCPLLGSWFDGANCYVAAIPPATTPFLWSNSWYVEPACHP